MSFVTSVVNNRVTFVTWKWLGADGSRSFQSKHVNVLYAQIARHYPRPFRFVCITDDPAGLDPKIEALPIPEIAKSLQSLQNPRGPRFPNCYCRLWNFSEEAAALLGPRIFQIDIDVVITGDLRPLVDRDEDFVGWTDKRFEEHKIAGGAYLLKTGSMKEIWTDFDPERSPAQAFAAGFKGSDQGWISYKINNGKLKMENVRTPELTTENTEGTENIGSSSGRSQLSTLHSPFSVGYWSAGNLVKLNWTQKNARIAPRGARIVFTSGVKPPWSKETRRKYPWVREYWQNG